MRTYSPQARTRPASRAELHERSDRFARALTELSRQHRLGLTGSVCVFVMESEDLDLTYSVDDESMLSLG